MHNKNKIPESWLFKYTLLFVLCSIIVFWQLVYYGKSVVNGHDGYFEVFNFLVYWGNYLRSFVANIFKNHELYFSSFDLSLGLGGNTFGALNFYGLGDFLNLFAFFFSPEKTELFYTLLVFIRLYLAGIAFFCYCKHHKMCTANYNAVLLGAIIYVFSYWTIQTAALHPYFLNPLIYFPFILLGVDKILEDNKPACFIISCTLALYACVYFFYMMTVLAGIYAFVRYFFLFRNKNSFRHFLFKFSIALTGYLAVILMGMPIFLPFIRTVLSGGRVGSSVPIFYELLYYIKLPIAFVNATADHYSSMGYTVIGLAAVILMFFQSRLKEFLEIKILFVLCLLIILFPFGGHIMNGFGYATNRWIWGFNLLVSVIIVNQADSIFCFKSKYVWGLGILSFVFVLPTFWVRSHGIESYKHIFYLFALLFCLYVVFMFFIKSTECRIFIIVLFSLFLCSYNHFSPYFFNYVAETKNRNTAYDDKMNSQFRIFDDNAIDKDRQYRIDFASSSNYNISPFDWFEINSALIFQRYGTALYYSTNDTYVRKLFKDLRLPVSCDLFYVGLNERAFLEAFLGCRYCTAGVNEKKYLAFGYDTELYNDKDVVVFFNKNVLPIVFTYDSYMNYSEYKDLSSVEKQQSLLQTASIDFIPDSSGLFCKHSCDLVYTDKDLEYSIENVSHDLMIKDKTLIVDKPGAFVDVVCDKYVNGEYYIVFDGLNYENGIKKTWNSSNVFVSLLANDNSASLTKSFLIREKSDQMYSNLHDFIYNIGYIENHPEKMVFRITFDKPGRYSFDKLNVVCQPVDRIADYVAELSKENINYHYANGRMFIQCDLDVEKIVCISAPFQKGSYAIVDGKKQKCFCVNNFATGIIVSQGKHDVTVCF